LYWVQVLRMIFQPSQGFFNMLIFFYHKVHIIRRNDEDRTIGDALRIIFKSPRESPEVVLVHNIEDVVYKDFALPKIIPPHNKLFIKQVDMFLLRGGDYDSTTSEKKFNAQLRVACESVKLHHDLSFASQSLGGCSTVMQEVLAPAASSDHELHIDEENDGTGKRIIHSLEIGRSNGDVE
jgi:hypothetical protein